jgi:TonB-linked SusC/RagA family outer membrane protein
MKNKLLKTIYMLSRYFLYGFMIQLLFLNFGLAVNANGQYKSIEEVSVQLSSEELTVGQFFREVQRQTPFKFSYDARKVDRMAPLTFSDTEGILEGFLVQAARQGVLSFRQYNHSIDVLKDEKRQILVVEDDPVTVTGKVTDQNNEPLPGATVSVRGTSSGTVTDVDGNFSLTVEEGQTISISFIGYVTQTRQIGAQTNFTIVLVQDSESLDEVIVTAFGIERQEKALSYSVQKLDGEAVSRVGNPNILNGLQGKIAGVTIRQTTGAPGSSPAINIRGSRSITGNNQPLYVVDGLPISGRIIDLNPSDIETINVLKGPTAAALYGLRASNGVIVITTNRGKSAIGKPIITVETGYNFDQVTRLPKLQTTYAQGNNGQFDQQSAFSFGPRIDALGTYTNFLGEQEEAAVYDNAGDFFKTGGTKNFNVDIANTFERGNYQIGIGYTGQEGIIENSSFDRINIKLASDYNITDKLKIGTSVNFSSSDRDQVVDGGGNSSLFYAAFFAPVTYNLKGKPIARPDNPFHQINFRNAHDNIYWSVQNNSNNSATVRTFGNAYMQYQPLEWLSVNYRVGLDYFNTNNKVVFALGSGQQGGRTDPPSGGSITDQMIYSRNFNSNFNINVNKSFGEDFQFDFLMGNEVFDIYNRNLQVVGNDITIGGFNHISNTSSQNSTESVQRSRVAGFFGNLNLAWKDMLFLNASGRNDFVSNMPRGSRSFFYPSVGVGFAFTELMNSTPKFLEFGKFRASVAEVGQAGPIYVANTVFVRGNAGGGFVFPFDGLNAFTRSNNLISANLQPENTRTTEIGIDLRGYNRRINLDYTYYTTIADGQIFNVPVPISTGYGTELRNAGQMSVKGHEIVLNLVPIQTQNFRWDFTTNFTTFTNMVESLADGVERLNLGGFRANIVAEAGQEYPYLRGIGYARDPASGEIVVDSRATLPNGNVNTRYGMPLRSTQPVNLGSVNPDFEFGFINQVSYKNFTFIAQIDWRQGGKISSGSNRLGKLYGSLLETETRADPYVFSGKMGFFQSDGTLVVEGENSIEINRNETFYRLNQDPIIESNVYDASFVRLREIRLAYDIPGNWLQRYNLRSASVYLSGRNLWLNASLPYFDPELSSGGGNAQGEEYIVYPQILSFGGGVRVSF